MSDEQQSDTSGAVAAYLNPDQGQPALAAKAAMTVAAGSNPDLEAELRKVAARTGVPLDAARAYPDEVKRQAALQAHDFDTLAHQFPGTTRFLSDPDNARIAHDDVANLSSTESTIGPIRGPKPTFWTYATGLLKSLPQGAGMAREGIRMQLADLFGQDAVREDAQRKYSQLSLEQAVDTPEFQSSTAQGVYSGLSSTIRAVPGLVASLATRSPTPMLATIGAQTEADAYGKYRTRGGTVGQALAGATGEGAVEVATELLPMGFLVKNMGKMGAGHFLTGLLAREVPSEQVATLVQDAIDTAIANPDKTWGDYMAERPAAAYQTLLATITQAGMMEGANAALGRVQGRSQEAQHAGKVGDALSQFNALAEASKVRERDAGTAQTFFQSLMQEGRDTVWITPKALAESGMLEQMAQALPDVAAQIEQASVTGADIRIQVADLIAHMAGPELEQSIIPHLSEEPGGFTKTTAEAYLQSGAAQELAEEVSRTLDNKQHDDAFTTSRAAVTAGFQQQLDAAGRFAPAVNQAYATMVGNFYAVQAARMGITPEEMATRYPLQVKAEAMPGLKTLDQSNLMLNAATKRFDQVVTEARHWLQSNGKTVDIKNLGPAETVTAIDEMMGTGVGNLSEQAKTQGRAIWDRLTTAHKQLDRFANPERYAAPDLVNVQQPADVETWPSHLQAAWKKEWSKFKKLAKEGHITEEDLAKPAGFMSHPASAASQLNSLVAAIRKRKPAANSLNQSAIPTIDDFADLGSGFTVADGKLLRNGAPVGDIKLEVVQEPKRPAHLVVRDIRVDSKGSGTGTMALAAIMGKASQYGLPVALTTESMLGKAHQKRLRAFYERLGFKKNRGADKVQGITEEYVWTPAGNTLNQFAGQGAIGADHVALQQAQSRLADGESAEAVRQETGWFKGPDDKWRFEISDDGAKFVGKDQLEALAEADPYKLTEVPLAEVLDHPVLFAAYPALKDITVVYEATSAAGGDLYHGASYNSKDKAITLGNGLTDDELKSALLHEIQHAIQSAEGFANGGSLDVAGVVKAQAKSRWDYWSNVWSLQREVDAGQSVDQATAGLNELDFGIEPEHVAELAKHTPEELQRKNDEAYADLQAVEGSSRDVYKRIAGEVEARNTQARAGMTDEQRKATPPSATADTPADKVIIVMAGKDISEVAMSEPLDQATGGRRGMMSFGDDITQDPTIITLLQNADLSTFLHESGHFFLEVLNDMAGRDDAPADVKEDMAKTLEWFGIPDLATWNSMDLEAKRPHHEAFARGFEAYLFEGKAPTSELAGLFSRFRSWLVNVYKSLTALQVDLSAEVRGVFDRMLASSEAIAQAEREQALAGMFGTRPEFMSDEEWTAYRLLSVRATEDATRSLETRSIKDMKWLGNAKSKMLRELQKEANFKRMQILNEVRKEVMSQPVYQAWQFLTLRGSESTRAWPDPAFRLDPKMLDTRVDNLYKAIAKLGGLNRDEVKTKWGVDHRDMPDSGVFGAPILRKKGGLTLERMAEKLTEEHYLDSHDLREFEDKFDRQRGGQEQYSWEYQYANGERAPAEPIGDSNYHGKFDTKMLRFMYGEDMFGAEPDVVAKLISYRMTSTDGGLDPDVVAEMLGGHYESGRALVDALVAAEKPSAAINRLVDQRMLERHGDLIDEAAIDRAVNEALHQKAHARFIQTEMAALQKAAGKPAILAKAAQAYAEQIVRRTPINQLRPDKFTAAAKRAGRAADKAFKAGDIQAAAAEKQGQLINVYAAKAALDARNEVEKTLVRFKTITNGNNEKVAKTRDLDMVMATRAILADYGIGTRGKKATEYLGAVDAYDPAMASVLRERIDAATENAKPYKELTIEQLGALRDEVESLWFLAKRSRQMEVDGDLLDRQDVQDQLRARLEEIGIPEEAPGAKHAITPGEVNLSKLQSLRASLRRVEAWAGAKDGTNEMGPFRRFIWNTVKDHADAYRVEKAKYLKRYRDLLDGVAPTLTQVKIAAPELGYTFGFDRGGMGKVELLHAILHTGNAGNKKKLLLGRRWASTLEDGTVDTSRWDAFVHRMIREGTLTRADFDFAQGVWDLLEEMKPAAQKAHREAFGRYFDEVTAEPFKVTLPTAATTVDGVTTPAGSKVVEYRGGYVPAIADSRIVSDAKTRAIMEDENTSLMNVLPSTSKGFTKSRVEYNRPLLLDLRLLAQHIDKVLLFSHLEQPVRDVRRVLGHSSVAEPLHLVDPAAYDGLLVPWLNRAARQQVETQVSGSNGLMRFFSVVRSRAGMAAMFANVSNTVQQITGFSLAALKVKPSHLMGAAVDFVRDPKAMARAVAEASPYMATRMDNEIEAMTGAINDILLNPNVYQRAVGWTQKHTYFLQAAVDNVMGPIIWHGAYNQALETAPEGMSDDEIKLYARRLADSAVRETQGSTQPEDISRIETGNAFVRMFSQFAGYFNMQANLLGTEFSKVAQDVGLRKGLGRGFYILLLGFLAPAWMAQAIALAFRGGPDDEDKDGNYIDDWLAQTFGWGTLRAGTALVPVVGQTVNAMANTFNGKPYDDRISTAPAISMIESAVSVPSDVYKLATGSGSGTKTVRDVASLVSLALGVPASAAARPVAYLTDINTGKAKPTGPIDVGRGLITGASSPASKGR